MGRSGRQARRHTSCLRLAAVPADVRRVLRECHVADLLPAYDDVGQALSVPPVTALQGMPTAS